MQNRPEFARVEFLRLCHGLAPLQGENNPGNFLAAPLAQNFGAMGDFGLIHMALRSGRYDDAILMQILFRHEE